MIEQQVQNLIIQRYLDIPINLFVDFPIDMGRVSVMVEQRKQMGSLPRVRPHHVPDVLTIMNRTSMDTGFAITTQTYPKQVEDYNLLGMLGCLENPNVWQTLMAHAAVLAYDKVNVIAHDELILNNGRRYNQDVLGTGLLNEGQHISKYLESLTASLFYLATLSPDSKVILTAQKDEICELCALGEHCKVHQDPSKEWDVVAISNLIELQRLRLHLNGNSISRDAFTINKLYSRFCNAFIDGIEIFLAKDFAQIKVATAFKSLINPLATTFFENKSSLFGNLTNMFAIDLIKQRYGFVPHFWDLQIAHILGSRKD